MRPFTLRRVLALVVVMLLGAGGLPAAAQSSRPAERPPGAWVHLGPKGGEDIEQFAVSPRWPVDPFAIARTRSSIVRTYNGGDTWASVSDPGIALRSLVVAPRGATGRFLYALGAERAGTSTFAISRSEDDGTSWSSVLSSAATTSSPWTLVLSPAFADDGTAFATHAGNLYRSRAFGATWEPIAPSGDQRVQQLEFSPAFASDQTILAAVVSGTFSKPADEQYAPAKLHHHEVSRGIMISGDGGDTWQLSSAGLEIDGAPYRYVEQIALSPDFAQDGTMFAFAWGPWADSHIPAALFRSMDRGRSWSVTRHLATGREQSRYHAAFALAPRFGPRGVGLTIFTLDWAGAPSPNSPRGCTISKTIDGGATWADSHHDLRTLGCSGLVISSFSPDDRIWFATTQAGGGRGAALYRSLDDGNTWEWITPSTSAATNNAQPPAYAHDGTVFVGIRDGIWLLGPSARVAADVAPADVPGAPR